MKNKNSFIVSDESLNDQRFRVLTEGIVLDRFRKNPVMLYEHGEDEVRKKLPIGRWERLRVAVGEPFKPLFADPVFDMDDPFVRDVARKVEKGFINSTSIHGKVLEMSEDPKLMLPGQEFPTVTKLELFEISICSIPSNGNAVKLSNSGDLMPFANIRLSLQNGSTLLGRIKARNLNGNSVVSLSEMKEAHDLFWGLYKANKLSSLMESDRNVYEYLNAQFKAYHRTKGGAKVLS